MSGDSSNAPPAMTFDHVAQVVPDVRAAVAWYCRTLPECRVLYEDDTWGFIAAPGVKLAFVREGQHPDHVAFRVRAAELERLAARHGAEIRTHRDQSRGFYVASPDGRWIEFITYPDGTPYGAAAR